MESFYTQLGTLNASLVGAEFQDTPPSSEELAVMLRTARALHAYAQQRLLAAREAALVCASSSISSALPEHDDTGKDYDGVKDTPCVGPCVHLWRGANLSADVRELIKAMQQTYSSQTAQSLYCQVLQLKPPGAADVETYQMCQLTGFPCSTFTGHTASSPSLAPSSEQVWAEAARESRLLEEYAEHVAHARVLQLEAASTPVDALRGGAAHRQLVKQCASLLSGRQGADVIRAFYKYQPDHRGKSVSDVLSQFEAACKVSTDEALDFLVSGAVVEPLVKRATLMTQPDVRAALRSSWQKYVSTAVSDFSSAQQ